MRKSILFITLGLLLFFTGCAPKATIKSLQSSKVENPSSKQLAILPFKNDTVGQRASIYSAFSKLIIEDKPYFVLVERENIEKLLNEKRLNDSALVDIKDYSTIKGLTQAKSFLFGEVLQSNLKKQFYTEVVNNYNKCAQYNRENRCIRYAKIFRQCQTNTYTLQTHIKLTEVESANVLFAENYEESETMSRCSSGMRHLPSKAEYNTILAKRIASRILKDIAPSYYTFNVALLDDMDIELNDSDEKAFENALVFIENNRLQKAQEILEVLNEKLAFSSYIILYNLGITYEGLNRLEKALQLYENAESIAVKTEINEAISEAILRVKYNLKERKRVQKLIK